MCSTKAPIRPDAKQPQRDGAGQDRHEQLAQELAVVVELGGPEVHLQVADHVGEDEAHQADAGEGHHPLLADRRLVEVDERQPTALHRLAYGGDVTFGVTAGAC